MKKQTAGRYALGLFAHLSLSVPTEGSSNEWCEPVTDKEYRIDNGDVFHCLVLADLVNHSIIVKGGQFKHVPTVS